ncbi:MAG: carbohydrate ABC transporter substrate-binding protein [Christensenellaceae bacterium]|nr:carbohydrate ABC transporter substrate-binding protein [Christensenellaceae bacterium]
MRIKRWIALFLALLMIPAMSLAEGESDHTLVVAQFSAATSDPRLEYIFFSHYPDGRIVYMTLDNLRESSVQLLAGVSPDIILFNCGQIPRYAKVDIIEDLYEQVFPDGYPEALAPQARHLMELDGRLIGLAEYWLSAGWSINRRFAEKLGYEIPEDGWTEQDLLEKYFDSYTGDTDGDGVLDVWFTGTAALYGSENVPIIRKLVYIGAYDAMINHANDLDYLLSEDFLAELEFAKLLTNSEKLPTCVDENGDFIPGIDVERNLFNTVWGSGYSGPYRSTASSSGTNVKISRPAFLNGEPNSEIFGYYYCLMRAAPHHDLAVEVMRMIASEEYQALYDSSGKCFGAKEPVRQITALGGAANIVQNVAYSDIYHAEVRVVDASVLGRYQVSDLEPFPEAYQEQLEVLEEIGNPIYDNFAVIEVCDSVFWPAFREYCEGNMTAEAVARLMYQRLRIALYE